MNRIELISTILFSILSIVVVVTGNIWSITLGLFVLLGNSYTLYEEAKRLLKIRELTKKRDELLEEIKLKEEEDL